MAFSPLLDDKPLPTSEAWRSVGNGRVSAAGAIETFSVPDPHPERPRLPQTRPSSLKEKNRRAYPVFNIGLDGPVCVFGVAGSKVRDRLKYAVS